MIQRRGIGASLSPSIVGVKPPELTSVIGPEETAASKAPSPELGSERGDCCLECRDLGGDNPNSVPVELRYCGDQELSNVAAIVGPLAQIEKPIVSSQVVLEAPKVECKGRSTKSAGHGLVVERVQRIEDERAPNAVDPIWIVIGRWRAEGSPLLLHVKR